MRRVAGRVGGIFRIVACLTLLAVSASKEAFAVAPVAWRDTLYSYRSAADQPLGDVLSRFVSTVGLELKLSDPALGRRKVALLGKAGSPADFLDRLADAQGLNWFVYQGVLHVSTRSSAVSSRIPLHAQSPSDAREALIGIGLFEARFGWGEFDGDPPSVLVSGPADYVRLVQQALVPLGDTAGHRERPQMMVFRLNHASANDREMRMRDRTLKMPGLVSTLNQMLQVGRSLNATLLPGLSGGKGRSAPLKPDASSLRGDPWALLAGGEAAGLAAANLPLPGALSESSATSTADTSPLQTNWPTAHQRADAENDFSPAIAAYTPLNAVLVWDLPSRRGEYAAIIRELDVPSRLIEINVTILDVSVNALRDWSVDFNASSSRAGMAVSASGKIGADGSALSGGSTSGTGVNGSTIALWASDRLAVRLRALESRGQAQVLSRPSVLTLDNVGAMLDMNQSAYVKLVGERTADLRTITAGTLLRVTPSIVGAADGDIGSGKPIRVTLDIEDGQLTPSSSDGGAPAVGNSSVSTEALVRPGESLVVGGYRRQNRQTAHGRIPGLGSMPLIGGLFRSDSTLDEERERLFILTARVLP